MLNQNERIYKNDDNDNEKKRIYYQAIVSIMVVIGMFSLIYVSDHGLNNWINEILNCMFGVGCNMCARLYKIHQDICDALLSTTPVIIRCYTQIYIYTIQAKENKKAPHKTKESPLTLYNITYTLFTPAVCQICVCTYMCYALCRQMMSSKKVKLPSFLFSFFIFCFIYHWWWLCRLFFLRFLFSCCESIVHLFFTRLKSSSTFSIWFISWSIILIISLSKFKVFINIRCKHTRIYTNIYKAFYQARSENIKCALV